MIVLNCGLGLAFACGFRSPPLTASRAGALPSAELYCSQSPWRTGTSSTPALASPGLGQQTMDTSMFRSRASPSLEQTTNSWMRADPTGAPEPDWQSNSIPANCWKCGSARRRFTGKPQQNKFRGPLEICASSVGVRVPTGYTPLPPGILQSST